MDEAGNATRDIGLTTRLVGALTGQYELSEADQHAIGEWVIAHVHEAEVHDLLMRIVTTQITDTSEWRVDLAEALRQKYELAPADDQNLRNP